MRRKGGRFPELSLIAIVLIVLFLPVSPGCFCVESDPLKPEESISRSYEGYLVIDETGESFLFAMKGLWERGGKIEAELRLPGQAPEDYQVQDIDLGGGVFTFEVTIPAVSNLPLLFETTFDSRYLAGTFEIPGGEVIGSLIGVSIEGRIGTEFDLVGAYELVTVSTDGDTMATGYSEDLSVRLEFERDGTVRTISRFGEGGNELVETWTYGIDDGFLRIEPEGETSELTLPVSVRGFVVNKDLIILGYPRPFPSFDSLVPVEDGIQVEHFKQVI